MSIVGNTEDVLLMRGGIACLTRETGLGMGRLCSKYTILHTTQIFRAKWLGTWCTYYTPHVRQIRGGPFFLFFACVIWFYDFDPEL